MLNLDSAETAYLAGLFEGEGCVGAYVVKGRRLRSFRWVISMTDRSPLRRCQKTTGLGHLYGPYQYEGKKPIWRWVVTNQAEIDHLTSSIYSWLSPRRKGQIRDVRKYYR